MEKRDLFKIGITVIAAAYFLWSALSPSTWRFLDNVHLIIHEAGHIIFLFFGDFVSIAGGTLLQLIIPILFIGYFYLRGEYFSASLLLFWLGSSLMNVYVYAADAVAMQLPLLGGHAVIHDWNYMLGRLDVLDHTSFIANSIRILGILTILAATYFSLRAATPPRNT